MKNKKSLLILSILGISSLVFGGDKILMAGCGWNSIAQVDQETNKPDWVHQVDNFVEMNSICQTKEGNIAVTNKKNLLVLDKNTREVLWTFNAENNDEIHSVSLLKNGNLVVGMCANPSRIIELDSKGNIVNNINFESGSKAIHPQFRQLSLAENGNYIAPLYGGKGFLEIDKKGNVVEKVDMPIRLFASTKLKNGNYLLSGEAAKLNAKETAAGVVQSDIRIIEYSPKEKKIVRTIDKNSIDGVELLFIASIIEKDNGNLLITNFNGHSKDKKQLKLFEIDKNNKLVWKLDESFKPKNITGIHLVR
ncbi:MAG: hypothetical protein R3Y46_00510 [Opitutales bacterium]